MASSLQAFKFDSATTPPTLFVLDQLLLPHRKSYIKIQTVEDAFTAITSMNVRGAPLIALTSVLALAVDISSSPATHQSILEKITFLKSSRPTAVNLSNALNPLLASSTSTTNTNTNIIDASDDSATLVAKIIAYSKFLLSSDLQTNLNLSEHGASALKRLHPSTPNKKYNVVTICNTGSLATSGHGTALGVIRTLHKSDNLNSLLIPETRPYNQGSRLTAFEAVGERVERSGVRSRAKRANCWKFLRCRLSAALGFPLRLAFRCARLMDTAPSLRSVRKTKTLSNPLKPTPFSEDGFGHLSTLCCDSAVAAFMSKVKVDAAFVGADRVVANGDTANKIGTFQLAITCKQFAVPLFVCCPLSTIDLDTATGGGIEIEERKSQELLLASSAPREGVSCFNPAFDVTPGNLIAGIVTEHGVIEKNESGLFDVGLFVHKNK